MKLQMLHRPCAQKGSLILCLGVIFAALSMGVGAGAQSDQTSRGQASQAESQTRFQRTFALASNGRLLVDNHKGKISIEGWDRDQVVVDVYKNFEGTDTERKRWMSETEVKFFNDANRVEVDVKYPDYSLFNWSDNNGHYTGSVELTIHAPRKVNLELRGHKPEMRVSSIQGNIEIKSCKSPIRIDSTVGAIRINTYKETVRLTNVDLRGRLDLRMYKGEALVDLKGIGDGADLETSKGELVVRLPETEGLSLEVEGGRRTSFHSDFPIATEVSSGYLVRGTINRGGPRVRLRTEKGSISLQKRGGV